MATNKTNNVQNGMSNIASYSVFKISKVYEVMNGLSYNFPLIATDSVFRFETLLTKINTNNFQHGISLNISNNETYSVFLNLKFSW